MRREKDLLGEKEIPSEAYYGIHTARAVENFPLSPYRVHPRLIVAMATVKKAAAQANCELGYLAENRAGAIIKAAEEMINGQWHDQVIVDALQGGAGTSTNMNINEVLANRAIKVLGGRPGEYDIVHPLNDVNMHQSTNDVYPTALKIAALWLLKRLHEECSELQQTLQQKEAEFAAVVKVGRTEMQDAVPITLGQSFSAYAQAVGRDRWRLYKAEERLKQVNLGGTAVGTGLNAPLKYIYLANEYLRQYAGVAVARAENMIDVTQNADVFVEVSGLVKALAVNLAKIASDLRLLSSGPRAGLGEIILPKLQAGSSIMPGKVNPVIPEAVNQAAYHVIASDLAITMAAQAGQLELNAFLPLVAHHLLASIEIMTNAVRMLAKRCIAGIRANEERCLELVDKSLIGVAALVPHIGYDKATEAAALALKNGCSLKESVCSLDYLDKEKADTILNLLAMTRPGIVGNKKQ